MKNALLFSFFCFCSLSLLADGETISPNLKSKFGECRSSILPGKE